MYPTAKQLMTEASLEKAKHHEYGEVMKRKSCLLLSLAVWFFIATPRAYAAADDLNPAVEKSIVQLQIEWGGYVLYPTDSGDEWSDLVTAASNCSGWFVDGTGRIVTAGHCVEPSGGRESLIKAFLAKQVEERVLTQAEAGNLVEDALTNWKVESKATGTPPTRIITAIQPKAVDGAVLKDKMTAQMVDFRAFEDGDLALLKVEASDTPALPVGTADPKSGSALTAVGFPGNVGQVVDLTRIRASFKSGTASSHQVSTAGVAQTEINADLARGMSGGPTVDALGNVIGVNSKGFLDSQAFNFITDTTDLKDWLTSKGVTPLPPKEAKSAAPAPKAAVEDSSMSPLVWMLGVVVLAVLIGAGTLIYYLRKSQPAMVRATGPFPVTQQLCSSCHHPVSPGTRFCSNCGSQVTGGMTAPSPT